MKPASTVVPMDFLYPPMKALPRNSGNCEEQRRGLGRCRRRAHAVNPMCHVKEETSVGTLHSPQNISSSGKDGQEVHADLMSKVYALDVQRDGDVDDLKQFTDQEVQKTASEVLKLHRQLGHASRQTFVKMLRDRGAKKLIRTLVSLACPLPKLSRNCYRTVTTCCDD